MSRSGFRAFQILCAGNQSGIALILVLWIFIFLAAVAFDFSMEVREEAAAAHRFSEDTEGYYLAVAGFQRGLYEYILRSQGGPSQGLEEPPGFFDGSWHQEKLGTGSFRVRLIDEGGKINLNRIDESVMRRIFTNLGVEEPRRSILIDSILDWLDPDNLHRAHGAEADYYLSLSTPYTAKNGLFHTIEELLWVRGVTEELFFGSRADEAGTGATERPSLAEIFTVDSPIDRVNLRTTSAEVIHALLGIPLAKSRAFVEERKKLSEKTIADLLPLLGITAGDVATRMFVFANPAVISVEAEGSRTTETDLPRRVRAVVRVGSDQRGFEMVRWIDRATGPTSN